MSDTLYRHSLMTNKNNNTTIVLTMNYLRLDRHSKFGYTLYIRKSLQMKKFELTFINSHSRTFTTPLTFNIFSFFSQKRD